MNRSPKQRLLDSDTQSLHVGINIEICFTKLHNDVGNPL